MNPIPLVLVVGSPSAHREGVARTLIDRGRAVVLCGGPPACPLIRGDRCVVVEAADVTVVLEPLGNLRRSAVGLELCAHTARRSVAGDSQPTAGDLADAVDAALASS